MAWPSGPSRWEARDSGGNLVSASVTADLVLVVAVGGTLNGTKTISAPAGVATYTNLNITSLLGGTYRVRFTASGISVQSANIVVSP